MSRTRHHQEVWVDGHDRLRVAEQYPDRPQDGLLFRVEQRTTLAGRSVLLPPEQAREIAAWITERAAQAEANVAAGQRPYDRTWPTPGERGRFDPQPDPWGAVERLREYAWTLTGGPHDEVAQEILRMTAPVEEPECAS